MDEPRGDGFQDFLQARQRHRVRRSTIAAKAILRLDPEERELLALILPTLSPSDLSLISVMVRPPTQRMGVIVRFDGDLNYTDEERQDIEALRRGGR